MPAVEVTGLTVRYGAAGTRPAVDGIDLSADAGEVLVVLGPNGAGKTSTVEVLEGYRRPADGRVRVLGLDPRTDHAALSTAMGVMLQRGGVYPMLGPRRALDLFAGYYPDPVPTAELLELAGLGAVATTPWRHLSGGEQQRLSLALALIGRPRVAFLDEPTAGVDPEGRLVIRDVVAGLKQKDVCVLLTTHELDEAQRLADRIVILSAGRVVLEGTPQELTAATGSVAPAITFGATPGLDTASLARALRSGDTVEFAVSVRETAPGRYRVEGESAAGPAATAAIALWLAERDAALTDLTAGRTLEDVYFDVVGTTASHHADTGDMATEVRRRSRRGGRGGRARREGQFP
jgi:ABC-2 type transport system ATP-binding protein